MPRVLPVVLARLLAAPASAQGRYQAACVASSDDEPAATREQAEALCRCSAERALLPERGLTPAALDASGDFAGGSPDLDLESAPEAMQETGAVGVGSLMERLIAQGLEELFEARPHEGAFLASGAGPRVRPGDRARGGGTGCGRGT